MQIHNLPERPTISDSDQLAVDTGATTGKVLFSVILNTIKAAVLNFTGLTAKTTASDTDVLPIDSGSGAGKITFGNLKNQIMQKANPAYTSGDAASPAAWTAVNTIASGEVFTSILNKLSTMAKNVRYLHTLIGDVDITGTGKSTITGAIGQSDISGFSEDGTLSGGLSALRSEFDALGQQIGTVETATASVAVTSAGVDSAYAQGPSLTLGPGVWVITGQFVFPTGDSSGARNMSVELSPIAGASGSGAYKMVRLTAASQAWASLEITDIESLAETTTVYLKGAASITSSTAATCTIKAVRIK